VRNSTTCKSVGGVGPMVILGIVLLSGLAEAAPEATATVTMYFTRLDTFLSELTAEPSVANGSAAEASDRFAQLLAKFDGFVELLRTDSKGRVVSEAVRSAEQSSKGSSLAAEPWFATVMRTSEPFYGSVGTTDDSPVLLWAKPIRPSTKGRGGVLVAKIGLKEALAEIARKASLGPFEVTYRGMPIHSHEWDSATASGEAILAISGLDSVRIGWSTVTPGESGTSAATVSQATATGKAQDAAATTSATTKPEKRVAGISLRLFISLAIGGVIVVAVLLVFFMAGNAARRHHEKLMRDIEETSTVTPHWPPTRTMESVLPQPPPTDSHQPPPTGSHKLPPTDSFELPHTDAQDGLEADLERTIELSHVIEQYGPSAPPAPPSQDSTPSDPPAPHTTTMTSLVSPELYEQLRGQIRNELAADLQAQISREIDAAEQRLQAKAEALTSSVETHVNQLLSKLSDAEAAWNGVTTALKHSTGNLQQAVQQFKQDNASSGS
jgi:hypothetical protein